MMPPARCDAIDRLNETLVVKALGERLVRTHRVRAETTVVEANVSYPTNSGLLPKAVTKIVRIIKRIKTAGGVTRARLRNRTRSAGRRLREISAFVRRRTDQARDDVLATTGRLAELAGRTVGDARRVLTNARRGLRRGRGSPRLGRIIGELADAIETIIDQTRRRLAGAMPARADRVVSLHDRDARPIPKGRIDRPVEFGYKAQTCDNHDGIVLDYSLHQANPPDGPLAPAIGRIRRRTGKAPPRGHGGSWLRRSQSRSSPPRPRRHPHRPALQGTAIQDTPDDRTSTVVPTPREMAHRIRSRISHLKHPWAMDPTLTDGTDGTHAWCGWAILSHNLQTIDDSAHDRRRQHRTKSDSAETPIHPPGDYFSGK